MDDKEVLAETEYYEPKYRLDIHDDVAVVVPFQAPFKVLLRLEAAPKGNWLCRVPEEETKMYNSKVKAIKAGLDLCGINAWSLTISFYAAEWLFD